MTKTTDIPLSTFAAATADLDLGSNKLTAVADPIADQDAATKKYVDDGLAAPRGATTKNGAATLSDGEVLGGLVLVTAAAQIDLPTPGSGNAGADLFVSATVTATLVAGAGFHGAGSGADTLTLAAGEGAHVYSDGANWYLLGSGPNCSLS